MLNDRLCPACRTRAAAEAPARPASPAPFGLWLWLGGVTLAWLPFRFVTLWVRAMARVTLELRSGVPAAWLSQMRLNVALCFLLAGLAGITLPLFLLRLRGARPLMIALCTGWCVCDGLSLALAIARQEDNGTGAVWLLVPGLWLWYFARSPHVRAVFVR